MNAQDIALKAAELVNGDRERTHGAKAINFANIAQLWSTWLFVRFGEECPLTAADVAKMMTLLKIARMESGTFNPDDAIDACGYAAIAGELAESPCRHGVTGQCGYCDGTMGWKGVGGGE